MKKRLLSLLLVMMMLITAMPLAAAQSTNNYKVDWLVQNNIVQGRGDGELSLGKNITRAEFTKMVLAVTGELNQANLYAAASAFKDVNNHWAKNIISYATQRGYLAGYQDGSFRPNAHIKLDECIAILARLNPDFAEPKVKTGYWAQAYIDYAKTSGILNGIANTNNLKTFATRETAFNMVYNEVQVYTFVNKKIAEEARRLLEEDAAKKEEEAREEEARKARERKERRERQERREREERLDRYYRTEYNVYFNLGSGYVFTDRVLANTFYKLPLAPSVAPSGKKFKEWSVNGTHYYNEGAYALVDGDLYISPVWENISTPPTPEPPTPPTPAPTEHKVEVIGGVTDHAEAAKGTRVTVTATVEPGKKFVKWVTIGLNLTEAQKKENPFTFTMPANDVKFTAVIEDDASAGKTYKVTAKEAKTSEINAAEGQEVKVTAETKPNMEFDKWETTDLNLSEAQKKKTPLTFKMPAHAVTITATFKAKTPEPPVVTEHTVTFNYKGHGTNTTSKVKHGEQVTAPEPAPIAEGFDFGGWYKDEQLSKAYNFDTETVTSDLTLYAKWTKKEYTVTFNYKGHGTNTTSKVKHGEQVTAPEPAPIAEGFDFGGWYKDEQLSKAYNFDTETVTSNITLYAKWDEVKYEITVTGAKIEVDGSELSSKKVKAGTQVKVTANNAEEGQEFAGWKVEGIELKDEQKVSNQITFKMPANNVTIKAVFADLVEESKLLDALINSAENFEETKSFIITNSSVTPENVDNYVEKIKENFSNKIKGKYLEAIQAAVKFGISYGVAGNNITKPTITITSQFHHTKAQEAEVNNYVDSFIRTNITKDMSDYEKIKAVHDYIVTNAAYVALNKIDETTVSIPNTNKYGISVHSPYALSNSDNTKNIGVCQAYAGLFQKFMDKLKIKCYYVTGSTTEPHAWNLVKVGGKYYNIDLTYDDPVDGNKPKTEQNPPKSGLEGDAFFLKGNESFKATHKRESLTEINVEDKDYSYAPTGYIDAQAQN